MDRTTIHAYDDAAAAFAAEWRSQPAPVDMYALLERFFVPGGRTADIGCGAGRDVHWLNGHGFAAVGYDASPGLLAEARTAYPNYAFHPAALPELDGVANGAFDNVLCETVIMHLPGGQITAACRRLLDLLIPGGVLYLSWRVASDTLSERDSHGRLYASFDARLVEDGLRGVDILLDVDTLNQSSGKRVRRIVARRT
ncbi:class I SAM-dependent methyltransferase [Dyella sp. C11]|uniref:class I SAM-dependent methyltransferase n=1 Tax=Dyella sp. C11 TaxID=2126991 RepID=UPI000D65CE30|nr:class I SAM-dependent methyltransferase [Dyella sp. C11]